jgi:aryl-phospho-beta-D-glucosidase BglC (GH1 family)
MLGGRVDTNDLRTLGGEWRANHVRWQLTWGGFPRSPADQGDLAAYDRWLESELKRLDRLLPVCQENGLAVLIDLHTPPGGRNAANVCQLFQAKKFQDHFLAVWEKIARRYQGNRTVWGYDLVNEPVEGEIPEGVQDWQALALQTARLVRRLDPDHAIIVEPAPWGGPEALENLDPLPVPGVVYSVHMYQPHAFTHQGVYDQAAGLVYPGTIKGRFWGIDQLRKALQPVRDFQRDHNVHFYIGEFSAIRWAPDQSAERYLRDVIQVMEENGWDWAYHAFREWDGWSVEHGENRADRQKSPTPTAREKLLRSWFEKNQRPPQP